MPAPREPLAKLPLPARKSLRDQFESKVPELQKSMEKLGFPDYAFVANANQIYAYAAENSYGSNSIGACIHEYFENFIRRVSDFVKEGKDTESVEALKKVASKNVMNLVPDDDDKYSYCGVEIHDDQIWIKFNQAKLAYNIYDAGEKLSQAIDAAIEAQGGEDLPIGVRRNLAKYLDPEVPKFQQQLEKIFKKPYTLESDVAKNYAFLKAHKAELSDASYIDRLPEFIKYYWGGVLSGIGWKKFESDEMLQEAFNEAAEKGVIRFEVVEKIEFSNYCDCVFEDGECKVRTTPAKFGVNVDSCMEGVLDRL